MTERPFVLRPDQVDFTHARWCPVINCVLSYNDTILIVQRSASMRLYPGYWNGVSGFLDDKKTLEDKVCEELREELGLSPDNIIAIKPGRVVEQEASEYEKTWIVHPVEVVVNTDTVTIDWEAERYEWVTLGEARTRNLLPGFTEVLDILFPLTERDIPLGTYRHFKGDMVEVLSIALDSEDPQKKWVVYTHGEHTWVRPLDMFTEHIERDGYRGPRFVKV